jgi:hypothetical protein
MVLIYPYPSCKEGFFFGFGFIGYDIELVIASDCKERGNPKNGLLRLTARNDYTTFT